jgi:ketosteroid isomerase-like protein
MSAAPHDPVADELALRNLVNHYADAVSRQDAAGVALLFSADGEWEVIGHGHPKGRDEIAAFLSGLVTGWETIVHALLSGRVHLDPTDHDRASGRWYISEFGRRVDGTEVFFSGVYHDEYARDAGIWRFARRRYDSMFRRVGSTVTTSPFPADVPTLP